MAVNYIPKDLGALWLRSQVLIYHNSNQFGDCTIKKPDCFGNVLTSNFVITVASCFIELADTNQCFDNMMLQSLNYNWRVQKKYILEGQQMT